MSATNGSTPNGMIYSPAAPGGATNEQSPVNLSRAERTTYLIGGALLAALAANRRGWLALLAAPAGAYLAWLGISGNSPIHRQLGVNTAVRANPEAVSVPHQQGTHVNVVTTIAARPEEVFAFFRDFTNLPRVVPHLQSVAEADGGRTLWTFQLPGGVPVPLTIEDVNRVENEVIAWRTIADSSVALAGAVRLSPSVYGTVVRVEMEYVPPAGVIGQSVAKLLGAEPSQVAAEALRRLKQWLEAGEIATVDGQPSGRED